MTFVHLDAVAEDTLLGALRTAHRNVVAKLNAGPRAGGRQPRKDAAEV